MIDSLLKFSVERRWLIVALTALVACFGIYDYQRLPIDAVPDITNVQVQINASAQGFTPLEVEQRITVPVETALAGLPQLEYTRSLSRYGLSQVTVVFKEGTDIFFARQLVNERIGAAADELPPGVDVAMGPVATGLGEIFLYTVHGDGYDATELRTLQDWVIKPQLRQVPGIAEVNSIGGYAKQFHVTPDPQRLMALGLSFDELAEALEHGNTNFGAGYIERNGEELLVRAPGQARDAADLANLVITSRAGQPVRVSDVAEVAIGRELRTGAATRDGAETVLGTAIMLTGENSRTVSLRVAEKLAQINQTLPRGVRAETVYDRTVLVNAAIRTVQTNLLEGAILVTVVLLVLLGNVRAALLTALVIPLSFLMLISGMVASRVSANLMSLGALDFGLIVDAALIVVENCLLRLAQEQQRLRRVLDRPERLRTVLKATREVWKPSLVSVAVVVLVNLPLLALSGVEGKMFKPMAWAVIIALLAALVLSLTFVPAACALLLKGPIREHDGRVLAAVKRGYTRALDYALSHRGPVLGAALGVTVLAAFGATRLGTEFIPHLDEGDLAIQSMRIPGTSLSQSVRMQVSLEQALLKVPEVKTAFARVGTAEVATDPMPPSVSDGVVMLKPRSAWPDPGKSRQQLLAEVERAIAAVPGSNYEVSQPIQLRFNELISGVRSDVGVKLYGDDPAILLAQGRRIAAALGTVRGASDVKVEQIAGLPVLEILPRREALARHGIHLRELQDVVVTAVGGRGAGHLYEGDRRFEVIVRLPEEQRSRVSSLEQLPVRLADGSGFVPLSELAEIRETIGPNQIGRENGKRRLVISANVAGRDLGGFVRDARAAIERDIKLPAGYWLAYGGTFEQLESASARLVLLVPVTLALIFGLLIMTFGSARDALLVFSGVPLALAGGVAALALRGIPLSITAGVGFITLSGVAVLTGVIMVTAFRDLLKAGRGLDAAIREGAQLRLRPVLMIGLVASLGFLPMALNTGTGAEVQRPLATVVIGGILSATLLSLFVLPALYRLAHRATAPVASV
ncbi:MAG: CusA/CzcA family heavy metal efflux RND transporter [Pseudomonadota bacterium]